MSNTRKLTKAISAPPPRHKNPWRRGRRVVVPASAGVVLIAVAAVAAVVQSGNYNPSFELSARQESNYDACLLTDADGLSGSTASAVWSGMQAGAEQTAGRVNYLQVVGAATEQNATPFLNTLLAQRCDLVVAVGAAQASAVNAAAGSHADVRFGVVGNTGTEPNIVSLSATSAGESARQLVVDSVPEQS